MILRVTDQQNTLSSHDSYLDKAYSSITSFTTLMDDATFEYFGFQEILNEK